jgi:hypothetical protein
MLDLVWLHMREELAFLLILEHPFSDSDPLRMRMIFLVNVPCKMVGSVAAKHFASPIVQSASITRPVSASKAMPGASADLSTNVNSVLPALRAPSVSTWTLPLCTSACVRRVILQFTLNRPEVPIS